MYFLSLFMIFLSSYLVLSVISQKTKKVYGYLYLLLIVFSQIILSFEILSLFSGITRNNFLICNFIFLLASSFIFVKSERKFYIPEIKSEFKKILFALKRDKFLALCAVCFCIFLIIQIAVVLFFPIRFSDALDYYFTRALMWLQQGSIAHFMTSDSRELIMPVNFDMLYMMHIMFTHCEKGTAVFSFAAYSGTVYVLYCLIKELRFSIRQALWCVFVFSSFAVISIMSVIPNGELCAGGLLLASVFLFLVNVKHNDKTALVFSALAAAISIGVKTTAITTFLSVLFIFTVILFVYFPKQKFKIISMYFLFFTAWFLLFSSYNYVLNFIQYADPLTSEEHRLLNSFGGGFKSFLCSFLKYSFMFLDLTGMEIPGLNRLLNGLQNHTLLFLGLNDAGFPSEYMPKNFEFNAEKTAFSCFLGMTGVFIYIPSYIKALFNRKYKKERIIISALALSLIINIVIFSAIMVFTKFNNKYSVTFLILTLPVIAYSSLFKSEIYKIFAAVSVSFMLLSGSCNFYSVLSFKIKNNVYFEPAEEISIYNRLKTFEKGKVALFVTENRQDMFSLHKLYFDGFTIEKPLIEKIEEYDMRAYDYIIAGKKDNISAVVLKSGIGNDKTDFCKYYDYGKVQISEDNPARPVKIYCDMPYEYLSDSGFKVLFESENYKILKRE